MTIGDKYRFKISVPTLGIVEVFPVNDRLTWKYTKKNDVSHFVKELDGPLTFVDDPTKFIGPLQQRQDFSYIYAIERSRDRCFRVQFFVDQRCDVNDTFVPYWKGFFTMLECTFDVEKCRVDVNINVDDGTRCFLDYWDEPVNLVEGVSDFIPDPQQTFGQIRQKDCSCDACIIAQKTAFPDLTAALTVTQDCEDIGGAGWTILEHRGVFGGEINGNPWDIFTSWVRERVTSVGIPADNNGNPWTEITTNVWVRSPSMTLIFPYNVGYIDPLFPNTWQFLVRYKQTALDGKDVERLDNGRYLNTLLDFYFSDICNGYEIRSNFFGLNSDGTAPANAVYTQALADLQELVLMPTHDIVKEDETQSSFNIDVWSLKDLIDDLISTFNLIFFYDFDVSTWRLEHFTYDLAHGHPNLDLTLGEGLKYISGKWQYSYGREVTPPRETFLWPLETEKINDLTGEHKHFDGYGIKYSPSNCIELGASDEVRNIQIYLTNLFYVLNDHVPAAGGAIIQEDSKFYGTTIFVLIGTTSGRVNVGFSCLSNVNSLNVVLGWPCLHSFYWLQDRYLENAELNLMPVIFTNTKKIRTGVPILLPLCCVDFNTDFSPGAIVRTQLGDGEVVEVAYEEPQERLTLTLKYS